jgi:WD40 repeat protein
VKPDHAFEVRLCLFLTFIAVCCDPGRAVGSTPAWAALSGDVISAANVNHLVRVGMFEMEDSEIAAASFSPDGGYLAACSYDGKAMLWDGRAAGIGRTVASGRGTMWGLRFSPDGQTLAMCTTEGVCLWDIESERAVRRFPQGGDIISCLTFAPDGQTLFGGDTHGRLIAWAAMSGQEERTVSGHRGSIVALTFSPDGRWLVSGGGAGDSRICFRNPQTLETVRCLEGHGTDVHALAFSPDGNTLATTGPRGVIRIWDVASGTLLRSAPKQLGNVFGAKYSRDGTLLVTASDDGAVRFWTPDGSALMHTLACGGEGLVVGFSPDGRLLATTSAEDSIVLWAVPSR